MCKGEAGIGRDKGQKKREELMEEFGTSIYVLVLFTSDWECFEATKLFRVRSVRGKVCNE